MRTLQTLVEMLRVPAEKTPDACALTFLLDGEDDALALSYAELDTRARGIAAVLVEGGAQPGDRAVILCESGLEFVCALFGVLYARMIAVPGYPLDPMRLDRSLDRLHRIAEDATPTWILSMTAMRQAVEAHVTRLPALHGVKWLDLDAFDGRLAHGRELAPPHPEDVSILQYTSGSTGAPKGVILTHANVMANQAQIQQSNGHSAETVIVGWVPLFHDMGLIAHLFQSIYLGGHAVLMTPLQFLQRPSRWLRAISRYRGTTSGGPNFSYDLCLVRGGPEEWEGLDLSSWTRAVNAGEPVRLDTCARFERALAPYGFRTGVLSPSYGMAEAAALISSTAPGACAVSLSDGRLESADGSVEWASAGVPCNDTTVCVVDPDARVRVPAGATGELWVQGPQVSPGYWGDPERTEQVFSALLASGEGPFLRTGDLGTVRDGIVFVTGRRKDLIVIRGENHHPQDIEATLEGLHPALRPGCGVAFSIPGVNGEELAIVHEVNERRLGDPDELMDAIEARIAQQHGLRPRAIRLIEARTIPKTSSGKLARSACRDELLADRLRSVAARGLDGPGAHASSEPAPASSAVECSDTREQLGEWMRAWVARRRRIDRGALARDALDRWGLDSLEAVELVAALSDRVGRVLPPTLLWERPTLAGAVAFALEREETSETSALDADRDAVRDVALVGIGCRFPGGVHGADAFWELLAQGGDAIGDVPEARWNLAQLFDAEPGVPGKLYTRRAGIVPDIDRFDAVCFGISPAEAAAMDPQQRLLLETTLEALEDAGLSPRELDGRRVGVFVGISSCDYAFVQVRSGDAGRFSAFSSTGLSGSVAAGRIAHAFGLRGPCLSIDTACSSSLVAVHLAVASLRSGECDLAIVGGVNALLSPELTLLACQSGTLAPDGRCKSFDARADGYVRAEGCGVVVLRRESEALAARQRVRARVRGSAVNHDGRALALTAPNGHAQIDVIRAALDDARLTPGEVSYVEAHGSGTALGDPIEVRSLGAVYGRDRSADRPLWIGSVKTNVGHLEAAAGICGLIKTVLALEAETIPAQLHLEHPNPRVDWSAMHVDVVRDPLPWPRIAGERRAAAVSSFGISGTNAHVVLEQGADPARTADRTPRLELLTLSALDRARLNASAERVADYLQRHADTPGLLADACFTSQVSRSDRAQRLAICAETPLEMAQRLRTFATRGAAPSGAWGEVEPSRTPRIAFLLSGQGTQYPGMARGLFEQEPVFRAALERCAARLGPIFFGRDLLSVMFSRADDPLLHETAVAQPALFALQIALVELLGSWGVKPDVVMGHSAGELAAACVAGVFDWEVGLQISADRARLMQSLPRDGLMAAIEWEGVLLERVSSLLPDDVEIAAYNAPGRCVVSGRRASVEKLAADLTARGARVTPLAVSHASHSQRMEPILAEFEQCVARHPMRGPAMPLISNLTGGVADERVATPEYWRRHVREPVRFDRGLRVLREQAPQVVIEIGPHPTLLGVLADAVPVEATSGAPGTSETCMPTRVPTLRRGERDGDQLVRALAQLHVAGAPIEWRAVAGDRDLQRISLPPSPLVRKRYWLGETPAGASGGSAAPDDGIRALDGLHTLEWSIDARGDAGRGAQTVPGGTWWLLDPGSGLGARLAARLEAGGARVHRIRAGDATRALEPGRAQVDPTDETAWAWLRQRTGDPSGVLNLWSSASGSCGDLDADAGTPATLDAGATSIAATTEAMCQSFRALIGELGRHSSERPTAIWVISRGVEGVAAAPASDPLECAVGAALGGLARVARFEHPELTCATIDVALDADDEAAAEAVWAELLAPDAPRTALREGLRLVPRLTPVVALDSAGSAVEGPLFDSERVYLISGGAGALGLKLASWLVERGATQVCLLSRREPAGERADALRALATAHSGVTHMCVDVTDRAALERALQQVRSRGRALGGVFHLAGVLEETSLLEMRAEQMTRVMAPKVRGAWHLHALTREDPLDCFVLFASMSGLLGLPNQGAYAAANAFLDRLAQHRHALGLPAASIDWSVWSGEGMAPAAAQERLERRGLAPIDADLGLRALETTLRQRWVQVAVLVGESAAIRAWTASTSAKVEPTGDDWRRELRAAAPRERFDGCVARLRSILQDVLGLEVAAHAPPDTAWADLGLDSLRALELRNEVARRSGLRLPASFAYDAATLEGAASLILERLDLAEAPEQRPERSGESEMDHVDLAELSDRDLLELVDQALVKDATDAAPER